MSTRTWAATVSLGAGDWTPARTRRPMPQLNVEQRRRTHERAQHLPRYQPPAQIAAGTF